MDAVKTMKNGKAVGSDNILAEVLKADPHATADILLPLFQDIWQKEKLPKEWKEGIIIKVPKKGGSQPMQTLVGCYSTCSDQ